MRDSVILVTSLESDLMDEYGLQDYASLLCLIASMVHSESETKTAELCENYPLSSPRYCSGTCLLLPGGCVS